VQTHLHSIVAPLDLSGALIGWYWIDIALWRCPTHPLSTHHEGVENVESYIYFTTTKKDSCGCWIFNPSGKNG
jgi:hypothetical protein